MCWFERLTSKGTDRLPAMVHRSHRGCVQLQPCWRPGWFQKTLSIKAIIGGIDWTAYTMYLHTTYAPSSSTRKTTRTASELRTGSVGSSGRRRVGRLTVSARWKITFLLVFSHFKSKELLVPRFEIPLPQMLSTFSAQPQRSQQLLVQP